MKFDPRDTDKYRERTQSSGPSMHFTKTRICKTCNTPRSVTQFRKETSTICNRCKGINQ